LLISGGQRSNCTARLVHAIAAASLCTAALPEEYAREPRWLTPEAVQGVLALLAGPFIHRLQAAEATPRHWKLWPRLLKPTLRWIAAELDLPSPLSPFEINI
jgi:hypothetical protein